eukprot:GILJ01005100.1.p1 GENE.GILJ01005100.1~~GILJ01005100.1.p1  ORF type:complete len:251 (+),score=42.94 GILJ01005100.1:50-802(+)
MFALLNRQLGNAVAMRVCGVAVKGSMMEPLCKTFAFSSRPIHPSSSDSGHIELIFGPMFSGKTTELIRRIRRYNHAKKKCLIIKSAKDLRYGDDEAAYTHDKEKMKAIPAVRLFDIEHAAKEYNCIGIDEGQFFPDVVEFAEQFANQGKTVVVAALDATFERKPFGTVLQLIPLAESVTKLTSVCMICNGEAAFTKRTTTDTQVELIGGSDVYMSVCRSCFHLGDPARPKKSSAHTPPMESANSSHSNRS